MDIDTGEEWFGIANGLNSFINELSERDLIWFLFYGPSTHFMSYRAWSVNLATLFLGKSPRQFTST